MIDQERDLAAAWDPDPLSVGDRVRVRPSGECDGFLTYTYKPGETRLQHFAEWNGEPGRVTMLDPGYAALDGHIYLVKLDCHAECGGWYARAELERL